MNKHIDIEKEDYGRKIVSNVRLDSDRIDIVPWKMIVSNVVSRIKDNGIALDSDFQRSPNLWRREEQSRLIESMIINIPLPIFYFDHNRTDDVYTVVDGLQRLSTIKNFILREKGDPLKLYLCDLEYLPELNGLGYEELPETVKRKINEFELNTYIINASTPSFIKKSIFKRINTGGLVLNNAEIRNAAFYGQSTRLLKALANSSEFKKVTRNKIRDTRMKGREIINRFLSFYILGFDEYKNLDDYYDFVLDKLNTYEEKDINVLEEKVLKAFDNCYKLFGDNAFRRIGFNGKFSPINIPLFECVMCSVLKLYDENSDIIDKIIEKKEKFIEQYMALLKNDSFNESLVHTTAKKATVIYRNNEILTLLKNFIKEG